MASKSLDEMFEDIARAYLDHALKDDVIDRTSGQAAVLAAATAVDKMRLLRVLPPEIVAILPQLIVAINERGLKPALVFQAMFDRLRDESGKEPRGIPDKESALVPVYFTGAQVAIFKKHGLTAQQGMDVLLKEIEIIENRIAE